jgi:phosphoenolpyruvate carboxylase
VPAKECWRQGSESHNIERIQDRKWRGEHRGNDRKVLGHVVGDLLEKNPVLARSIRLRNPYVDPLSLIQVALLRRSRDSEDDVNLDYALAATISGIAAGLRNTG